MRFFLDEDLSDQVARIARAASIDVVSSHEVGRNRLTDEEQLHLAGLEGRCLVTRNGEDYGRLTTQFFTQQRPHAGVLILTRSLDNRNFAGIARAIVAFAQDQPDGLHPYTFLYLRPARAG